jgi:hypothetical protein
MGDLLNLIWYAVAWLFRSRAALQTEVLALRHQLNVLRCRAPKANSLSSAWTSARRGEVHGEKTTAAVAGLEDLCYHGAPRKTLNLQSGLSGYPTC